MAEDKQLASLIEEMRATKTGVNALVAQGIEDDTMKSLFMGNFFEIANAQVLHKKREDFEKDKGITTIDEKIVEADEHTVREFALLRLAVIDRLEKGFDGLANLLGMGILKRPDVSIFNEIMRNAQAPSVKALEDLSKNQIENADRIIEGVVNQDKQAESRKKEKEKDLKNEEEGRNKSLIDSFTEPFKKLQESFNKLTENFAGKAGFSALLFLAISGLFTYFEPASQALADLLNATGRFFGDFGKAFRGEITFKEFFENNLVGTVVALLVPFTKTFRRVFKLIVGIFRRFFLIPFLAFQAIQGAVEGFMEAFTSGAGPLEIFYSTVEGAILGITEGIRTLLLGLVDLFVPERFREDVKNFFNTIIDFVVDIFKGTFDVLKSVGGFFDDVADGILGFLFGDSDETESRYMGGPVAAGTPYVVGEKGPELFVPGAAGGIVPNVGGAYTVVVNNNQMNQSNSVTNEQHSNISIVDEQQERTGL